ncbi:hypothetical protein SDC9_128267 [bioreactor metagenome]|uniref:VanZ-like domain-containing protein n=1 Tax=bioreactor metagenome TaxID=1076179 RepID=A0A645CWI0_9ZZZZ|nr:VanZ family protein [Paludibacter sp.]
MSWIKYWRSILLTLIILVLSFAKLPSAPNLPKEVPWDKIVHFFMYFSLTVVLMSDFYRGNTLVERKRLFILICIVYPLTLGILTEFCQSLFFFPRVAEWYDCLSNVAGFLSGWGFYLMIKQKFKT